jgi:hypothetical protein
VHFIGGINEYGGQSFQLFFAHDAVSLRALSAFAVIAFLPQV